MPSAVSLKCKLYGQADHTPCSGTTDDGTNSQCECWCHGHGWSTPVTTCEKPICPCCAQHIRAADPEDGAFCWDCGLYAHDKRDDCDNPEHR